MRIIEQLVYKITGDNKEFDKSLDTSERNVDKFGKVANNIFAGVTVTAVAMAVKKLGDLAIASATALDRVDKMSQKIGISRVAFQEWDFILSQSGASVDGLQMGVKTLSNAAAEARDGTKEYKDEFDRLGVSVLDVNGNMKDQETLFNEVFTALANTENQTERTAIANKLLGRSATELSPAFNAGGEAIENMRNQAHDLGLVMEDELIDQGVVLTDNIDQLKRAFSAWRTEALAPVIGVMVTVTNKILGHKKQISELETETKDLNTQSEEYKRIMGELLDPTKNLTDIERARLSILQQTQSASLEQTVLMTAEAYEKDAERIQEASLRLEEMTIRQNAFALAVNNSAQAQERAKELTDAIEVATKKGIDVTRERIELQTILATLDMTDNERKIESEDIVKDVATAQKELNELTESYGTAMRDIAILVSDGTIKLDKYAVTNRKFYNAVMVIVDELNLEKEAIKLRNDAMADTDRLFNIEIERHGNSIASLDEIIQRYDGARIKQEEGSRSFLAYAGVVAKATEEKNKLLAIEAQQTANLEEKEQARNEIIKNLNTQLIQSAYLGSVLGDQYDLQSEQVAIYTDAIKALIDSGLKPSDKRVQELRTKLMGLVTTTEDGTKSVSEFTTSLEKGSDAMKDYARSGLERANATIEAYIEVYKKINDAGLTNHELELKRIEEQYNEFERAGVDIVTLEKWKQIQLADLRMKEFEDWANIASQGLGLISDMFDSFSSESISKIGSTIKAVGQSTGDATTMAVGMVLELGGQVISFFDDMEERAEVWANNMINLSNEIAKTQLSNMKTTLDQEYKMQKDALDEQENLRVTALLNTLSKEEQAELKAQGFIEETKMERLAREVKEAREAGEAERANVLENAIQIQSIRDEVTQQREEAEREYRQKVAQYDYDKAELDKNIAIANAKIAMNKAIADLGWFNRNKKDEVRGLYGGLISEIQATPLPPLPSYDVGSIRIPETTNATVHKDEMILTAPQAEQARREGITIAPTKSGGNSINLMIYLDGKEIARNTIDNLNSGSVGTIKARVVK